MSYLNPHTHNLDGPDADGSLRVTHIGRSAETIRTGLDALVGIDRPRVVCLCGSTRFSHAFREANLRETLAGRIVLTIGCDMRSDAELFADLSERSVMRIKDELDVLHKRKIDLADEVLVLDVGGYVGESTRSEIAYAEKLGKPVRYLSRESVAVAVAQ